MGVTSLSPQTCFTDNVSTKGRIVSNPSINQTHVETSTQGDKSEWEESFLVL